MMILLEIGLAVFCAVFVFVVLVSLVLAAAMAAVDPRKMSNGILLILLIGSLFAAAPVKAQTPLRLCSVNAPARWEPYFQAAAAEFSRVVPMVYAANDCDIRVFVVEDIHTVCADTNWACAYHGAQWVYVSDSTYGQLAELLHEIMHVLGVHGHPCNGEDSAVSCAFDPNRTTLSEWDIATLQQARGR